MSCVFGALKSTRKGSKPRCQPAPGHGLTPRALSAHSSSLIARQRASPGGTADAGEPPASARDHLEASAAAVIVRVTRRRTRRGLHYCLLVVNGHGLAHGVTVLPAGVRVERFARGRARVRLWDGQGNSKAYLWPLLLLGTAHTKNGATPCMW